MNEQRAQVRRACLAAAEREPGLFSLTVPTGGGKTLSSLSFALRHAIRYGLGRVIYVAPFTTIIDQNADVFRRVMSPLVAEGLLDPVVEHHSNLDAGLETVTSRLAAENWDAPLIVTTSVQFFESLFANRTSRCRKLHRIARSVVILDEAQTLPVDLLAPSLRALRELGTHYGTSVVLCTATQPAIHRRDDFPIGLEGVREIVDDPPQLYRALRRVRVNDLGPLTDAALGRELEQYDQVLCIVNTRTHARALFEAGTESGRRFHLSALMCPAHRAQKLAEIRTRLCDGASCQVISTQLIEAGVDLDFPAVYRSLSGLDSLAQAAGRCNRNGRLRIGEVFVFQSEHVRSERYFHETTNVAAQILPLYEDPLALEAIARYFELYYWQQSARWDAKHVLDQFHLTNDRKLPFLFGFATVAGQYRLIEDGGRPVIIPWGEEGATLCEQLRETRGIPDRTLLRSLQRYTVQIPKRVWGRSVAAIYRSRRRSISDPDQSGALLQRGDRSVPRWGSVALSERLTGGSSVVRNQP